MAKTKTKMWMAMTIAVLAGALAGPVQAQGPRTFSPDMVDVTRLQLGVGHYDLVQNDVVRGDWHLELSRTEEGYRVVDGITMLPDVRETGVWLMSSTFEPIRFSLDEDFSRNVRDTDLQWVDGQITGESRSRRATESTRRIVPFSRPSQADAIFRVAAFVLAQGIDFSDGPVRLTWFSSLAATNETVELRPEGDAVVVTPAGTFQTRKIGIRGGTPENVLYISNEAQPRLVRVDVEGSNLRFEYRGHD